MSQPRRNPQVRVAKLKSPFLITPTYYEGLSRTNFRRLLKDEKLEAMAEWFFDNYEDPAARTPYESTEGGYQYIHGGPYDAEEEFREMFEGVVSESLIATAVAHVERRGGPSGRTRPSTMIMNATTNWTHCSPGYHWTIFQITQGRHSEQRRIGLFASSLLLL